MILASSNKRAMKIMNEAPLYWLETVTAAVDALKEIPLWGHPPDFPLAAVEEKLEELFRAPVKLSIENRELRFSDSALSGLGSHPFTMALELTPLSTPFYLAMGQEEIGKLVQLTLSTEKGGKGFTTPTFQEGFWHFFMLQVLKEIDELHPFGNLSLKIAATSPLPEQQAISFDISLKIQEQTLWARILCPIAFTHAFKAHFATSASLLQTSPLSKKLELPVRMVVAHTTLMLSEWKKVKKGDAILLDACSFDPVLNEGNVTLALSETPLFFARPRGDQLEITDYVQYNEEPMSEEDALSNEEESHEEEPTIEEQDQEHLWSDEEQSKELFDPQEIPLALTIEVARFKIALDKLLQLRPGNVIELPVRPEQGVDITIGGKKMAKGELVKLGDALAVKILELKK
jgi:flagellar motor switch protein FliN